MIDTNGNAVRVGQQTKKARRADIIGSIVIIPTQYQALRAFSIYCPADGVYTDIKKKIDKNFFKVSSRSRCNSPNA